MVFFVPDFTGVGAGAGFSYVPHDPPNHVTSSDYAPLDFLRTRSLSGDYKMSPPRPIQDVVYLLLLVGTTTTDDGAMAFNLVFLYLLGDDVAMLALPPEEGVVRW